MFARVQKFFFLWKVRCLKPLYPRLAAVFEKIDCNNSRLYFSQARHNYEMNRFAAALLNLNMTLYLNPNHFGALILRGRILIKENKFELAASDFLSAFDLSPVRFFLENIHQEALETFPLLRDVTLDANDVPQFLRYLYQSNNVDGNDPNAQYTLENSDIFSRHDVVMTAEEKIKFEIMGPITQEEVESVDWNQVFK
jgi:tetratricopeptide (TPR) repeat protein